MASVALITVGVLLIKTVQELSRDHNNFGDMLEVPFVPYKPVLESGKAYGAGVSYFCYLHEQFISHVWSAF